MFCPFCGSQINSEQALFCMNCGKKIHDDSQQSELEPPELEQPNVAQPEFEQPVVQQSAPQQAMYNQAPVSNPSVPQFTPVAQGASTGTTVVTVKTGNKFLWIPVVAIILAGVIAIAVFLMGGSKSDEEKIRDRINVFTAACNDMDMEAMMECMDRTTRRQYETMMGFADGLLGGITGIDLPYSDIATLFGMESAGEYEMIIEIHNIEINGDAANVEVSMSDANSTESENDTMVMCKEDDEWYIDFNEMTGGIKLFN